MMYSVVTPSRSVMSSHMSTDGPVGLPSVIPSVTPTGATPTRSVSAAETESPSPLARHAANKSVVTAAPRRPQVAAATSIPPRASSPNAAGSTPAGSVVEAPVASASMPPSATPPPASAKRSSGIVLWTEWSTIAGRMLPVATRSTPATIPREKVAGIRSGRTCAAANKAAWTTTATASRRRVGRSPESAERSQPRKRSSSATGGRSAMSVQETHQGWR